LKSAEVIVGRRKGEKKLVADERRLAASPSSVFFFLLLVQFGEMYDFFVAEEEGTEDSF
jgi:hypothetical protein